MPLSRLLGLFAPGRTKTRPLACRAPARRRLAIEPLEERALLSLSPALVADVNPFTSSIDPFRSPSVTVGSTTYFMADDGIHGTELWKSDGTEAGTAMVKDLTPGPASSMVTELVAAGESVYFSVRPQTSWLATLWKTDGTAAGTVRVAVPQLSHHPLFLAGSTLFFVNSSTRYSGLWAVNLNTGEGRRISDVYWGWGQHPVAVNDKVFFWGSSLTSGSGLWVSDGTENGTFRVKDLAMPRPGASKMLAVGDRLFFAASERWPNDMHGEELWISDGTEAGTRMVKDIAPRLNPSRPDWLTNLGGQVYFTAHNGLWGTELWKSDGTEAGTIRVKGTWPSSSSPSRFVVSGDRILFTALEPGHGIELWTSDGTEQGTVLVKDIEPGAGSSHPAQIVVRGGQVFFTAFHTEYGRELWVTDATETGTRMIKDIVPGPDHSDVRNITEAGGEVFFAAQDIAKRWGLWKTDGSEAGTLLVKEPIPGSFGSPPANPRNVAGNLFFSWHDGVHGHELWKSDGTSEGTLLIKDINSSSTDDSWPWNLTEAGGRLFFTANDGVHGRELWSTDGEGSTGLVKDIRFGPDGLQADNLVSFKGELFFGAYSDPQSPAIWRSNGTAEGTSAVLPGMSPGSPHVWRNLLFFWSRQALWATDGTPEGTREIKSGFRYSWPTSYTEFNGLLFFTKGPELWRTDGTEAGTVRVAVFPAEAKFWSGLKDVSGMLYFRAHKWTDAGDELWKSDGTPEGTVRVKSFRSEIALEVTHYEAFNGLLYFSASDSRGAWELWRSDGTGAGTVPFAGISNGGSFRPLKIAVLNDRLFVSTTSRSDSRARLWKTDGTEAGTVLVHSMRTGWHGPFTATNGLLFFCAHDGRHGSEPWVSNGTRSGTLMVADLRPGEFGSDCSGGITIGDTVYFNANDGRTGHEVWKLDVPKPRSLIVSGADAGGGPHVRAIDAVSGAERFSFFAYGPSFSGGVRVATGDINGDGVPDIITAAGPGGGPHIRVFNGADGQPLAGALRSFFAYQPEFSGGVHVAATDFNGDSFDDIVTAADAGGGPHVRIFSGIDGAELASFFAYEPGFSGGVRLAAADVDRDGRPDIITAPGPGGEPQVRVFDARGVQLSGPLGSFLAYEREFGGGVFVAAGDLNGDGRPEIVTGADAGGPHVRVFDGATGAEAASFYAFAPEFGRGVRVAVGDADGDGDRDIITALGPGGEPHLRAFDGRDQRELASFFAYQSDFAGGVFTAGSGLFSDALASRAAAATAEASHAAAAAVQPNGPASTGQPAGLSAEWLAAAASVLQAPQSVQAAALAALPSRESAVFDLAALLAADPSLLIDGGAELLEPLRRAGDPRAALEELLADESRWAELLAELSPALGSELSEALLAGA